MRVHIAYTVEVTDEIRRGIRLHYGKPGLATRAEVKAWYERHGSSEDDNLIWEWQKENESGEEG